MPRIARLTYSGAYYHVLSRGLERRNIYKTVRDRERYLEILEESVFRYHLKIHSYCLMSNHYHLLIQTLDDNLSIAMKYINGSYATYFNAKYKRVGPLFSSRFKSVLVEENPYILELSRYIHLNPVRAGMVDKAESYRWSSYRDFIGYRKTGWLEIDWLLKMFGEYKIEAIQKYKGFVESSRVEKGKDPIKEIVGGMFLGKRTSLDGLIKKYREKEEFDKIEIIKKELLAAPGLGAIDVMVENSLKLNKTTKRKIKIYLSNKYSRKSLGEIGAYYGGIQRSSVKMCLNRFTSRLEENSKLRSIVITLESYFTKKCEQ